MKKEEQTEHDIQHSGSESNQSAPENKNEFRENEPGINEPEKNDPTRIEKLPLIISKL
jgi:hypothetical protein